MALLGYARVSTSHQKLTSQVTELNTAGVRDDRVFTDMMSGATDEREGLQRLLAALLQIVGGDKLIIPFC
ncbi:recombinase family protein [Enterobacter hormaechei]|uniref:recombinase family protein n=1 Tax=Enterobacter hormaechei TaxID=158836 RepID=UPI001FECB582|nr:recombinase family protein [Enterobacter hormaechei]